MSGNKEWPNLDDQKAGDAKDSAEKANITGELQELGQRLSAAARALWQSEQRQEFQQEVSDGLRLLRDQLSGAVDSVKTNPQVQSLKGQIEQKVDTGRTSDVFEELRTSLTTGLRSLNEQLQRFSENLEQRGQAAEEKAPPTIAELPAVSSVPDDKSAMAAATASSAPAAADASKPDLPGAPEGPASTPEQQG